LAVRYGIRLLIDVDEKGGSTGVEPPHQANQLVKVFVHED
jgi:hypothetical protein